MKMVKGLYGSRFDICNSCGYCKLHHKHLTINMIKQRDCLNKQCKHLIKNKKHEWWAKREMIKQQRKDRKMRYV